ncbi:MAG: hypothetical protein JXJ04_08895 [Spirochaetales bacterium]|nr:hypothetical protein [Spirochaetales bacterium]
MFEELREALQHLHRYHSLVGLKAGTEVEGMNFEEIDDMRQLSLAIIPMTTKIGGPEARNDISMMLSLGIDTILAPMIESDYGLKNFIDTVLEMNKNGTSFAINLETITGYNNLSKMMSIPQFQALHQVTVGRSDLSGSINKSVDDDEVYEMTRDIVCRMKAHDKKTSVGGQVTPLNAQRIQAYIKPDCVNTRHMVVSCSSPHIAKDVIQALHWEKKFYEYEKTRYPLRSDFYDKRIRSIEARYSEKVLAPLPS